MDGNRRLGWIAIAIGVVALVVAVSGRGHNERFAGYGEPWHDRGGYGQTMDGRPGDGSFERGQPPFAQGRDGFGPGRGDFGPRHVPRFFLPFMILGGLFKLALLALAGFLIFQLIRRRRNGRGGPPFGRGGHGWPHESHGPDQPNAPQAGTPTAAPHNRPGPESYTGDTTNL